MNANTHQGTGVRAQVVNYCGQAYLCQLLVDDQCLPTILGGTVTIKLCNGYLLLQMANLGLHLNILLLCFSCCEDMASVFMLKLQLLLLQTSMLFLGLRSSTSTLHTYAIINQSRRFVCGTSLQHMKASLSTSLRESFSQDS